MTDPQWPTTNAEWWRDHARDAHGCSCSFDPIVETPEPAAPAAPAEGLHPGAIAEFVGIESLLAEALKRMGKALAIPPQPAAPAEGLPFIPHPDMPHEYHATCRICGEMGYINLTLIAGDEAVQVVKRSDLPPWPAFDKEAGHD